MKKTLLFTLLALLLLIILSIGAFAATDSSKDLEFVNVTVKVEFTTPVEIPKECAPLDLHYSADCDGFSFSTGCIKGETFGSAPIIQIMAGDAIFEGWDKDIETYVLNEDTTFTATINNDDCVPVYFKTITEEGEPITCMFYKLITEKENYLSGGGRPCVMSFFKKGKILDETNVPHLMAGGIIEDGIEYLYDPTISKFLPEPVGYEITESTEFVCTMKKVNADDVDRYTVTYKAEFTSPMELPEGYSVLWWKEWEYLPNSMITNVPTPRFIGDGMTFLGWDKEPFNTIVTGDMTFTAKFNNDGCVPLFFKSVDEDGKAIDAMAAKNVAVKDTLVSVVKKGDTLTEQTIPVINPLLQFLNTAHGTQTPQAM